MTEMAPAPSGDKITGPFSDDLAGRTVVHVSALMPGGWEFFDSARIVSIQSTESNNVISAE